jgi:hypothetical protein
MAGSPRHRLTRAVIVTPSGAAVRMAALVADREPTDIEHDLMHPHLGVAVDDAVDGTQWWAANDGARSGHGTNPVFWTVRIIVPPSTGVARTSFTYADTVPPPNTSLWISKVSPGLTASKTGRGHGTSNSPSLM